ncbi:hypothetical protein EWF20_05735 [Sulfolobus sp. S-194]|uniref:hypothetical protein n=1 Tax=Sulfolobus sp. S-194 TaxID=2512240 RepID=UPI0014373BD4|nr:hypothetical protein [Sulfolobus sp. S-194]QIW23708.1 hypothetical protein EWF20_05735 [Sulfolobus sp. S-194]
MKATNGLKWGLAFGLLIGLIASGIIYGIAYYPHMSELQSEYYSQVLNETKNVTEANLAAKELPTILPVTILVISGLAYTIGGALAGLVIAYLWEKYPSWIIKGLIGGVIVLLLSFLFGIFPLLETLPISLIIGLLISFRLNEINKKV